MQLMGTLMPTRDEITAPMEMKRRLVVSNRELTSALAAFHESAERSSSRLESLTRWLVGLTIVLVVLTAVLAALTVVLLIRS
jgi:hypothetical protein